MYRGHKISLVIPCHNEEQGLHFLLDDVPQIVDEVLIVDNCSTDNTRAVAKSYGANVVYEHKKGYGNAYRTGFLNAKGDIIVTMDADAMYPLESIERLVKKITSGGYDFITTRRIPDRRRGISSLIRYYGDVVLNIISRILFGVRLKDSQSGMWVFRKNILNYINLTSPGMAMSQELKIEAFRNRTIRSIEIPVLYRDERIGKSKLRLWKDGFGNLVFLFMKKWRDRGRLTENIPYKSKANINNDESPIEAPTINMGSGKDVIESISNYSST